MEGNQKRSIGIQFLMSVGCCAVATWWAYSRLHRVDSWAHGGCLLQQLHHLESRRWNSHFESWKGGGRPSLWFGPVSFPTVIKLILALCRNVSQSKARKRDDSDVPTGVNYGVASSPSCFESTYNPETGISTIRKTFEDYCTLLFLEHRRCLTTWLVFIK